MIPLRSGFLWLSLVASLGCTPAPEPVLVPSFVEPELSAAEVYAATGLALFDGLEGEPLELGLPYVYPGYSVYPLSYDVVPGFRSSAALWLPEGPGPFPGVLVLPGHFGDGKSSGECQDVAHALAARGVVALAMDMPGVEEWDTPDRRIHFEEGAYNRAALVAAGTSSLGLQLHMARRGLDSLLEVAPVDRVAVTGASGGGVLSFYLGLVDPRVQAVVLASPVGIPRADHEGGCFCDLLTDHAGPSPALLGALEQPSLWLSELERPAPEGLPQNARYEQVVGPHSYTAAMRAIALPWLDEQLGHKPADLERAKQASEQPVTTPGEALRSSNDRGAMGIPELALAVGAPRPWRPRVDVDVATLHSCQGVGTPVVVAGVEAADVEALHVAGWRTCSVQIPPADEYWEPRAFTRGHALADRPASALRKLSDTLGGAPIYASGHWAIPAAGAGVTWVARAPLHDAAELDPSVHPTWVHVPGLWWGGLPALYGTALAIDDDPQVLIEALAPMK